MKTITRILFGCLLVLAAGCRGQQAAASGPEEAASERICGVYRLYPQPGDDTPPTAPAGYEPCYISHYGRHGSRYLLDEAQYGSVRDVLCTAQAGGWLTDAGERVCEELQALWPQFAGRAGELTGIGAEQHRAIARRMARRQAPAFAANGRVRAAASATSRTQASQEAFCDALQAACPGLHIERTTDAGLNPYAAASGIPTAEDLRIKGPDADWRPAFERYCREQLDTERFLRGLFTEPERVAACCDPVAFERNFFYMAIHFAGCGLDTDWLQYIAPEEQQRLAACDAYIFYQEKGPSDCTSDRTWALAAHLLRRVPADADSALAEGVAADLRFGHDGCIMSLLTLLQADGWTARTARPEEAARMWDVSQIPMACNLQWVFYRPTAGHGDLLVQVLLNERPLPLPVTDAEGYCPWTTLRQFVDARCAAAFAVLQQEE